MKDTGIGISAEGQKKLFHSFSQVDASNTRKYGGTGLGLAICKELVQLMGGEIGVESVPDRGSTFWFTAVFEALTPEEEQSIPPRKDVQASLAVLAGKKLLVVDDNATNRKVVRLQAQAWGMEVDEAQNGTMALAILRLAVVLGKPYDLALLDMQMPEMTGEMLGQQIRNEAEIARSRLILMTSLDHLDLVSRVREIGFDGYLLKPIVASRLFNCLLEVVEGASGSAIAPPDLLLSPRGGEIPSFDTAIAGKILVVEDTPVNQKVVLNQLRLLGYEADCANDGREALQRWEAGHYDLIFMDCQMPVMDGYQATQVLRQREGNECHTIIVGLTAYAMKGDREKCLDAGMDDYLSKPVSKNDLSTILEKWLFNEQLSMNNEQLTISHANSNSQVLTPDASSLIDREQFDAITDGDREFQIELLQSFLDGAWQDLSHIKQALAADDLPALEQKAHRIKGAAANLAITELSSTAAVLEQQARDDRLENPHRLLAEIEGFIEEVQQFLEATLISHQSPVTSHQAVLKPEPESGFKSAWGMARSPRHIQPSKTHFPEGSPVFSVTSHQSPVIGPETHNPQPTTHNPLIDRELLQTISGGDLEFEVELLNSFLTDIEREWQATKAAFEAENYADLIQRANSFKGAAESVAVGLISDLAVRLIAGASQQDRETLAAVMRELDQVLHRVKIELEC
ncbi:MAG: response regulator [Spirulina sp.]